MIETLMQYHARSKAAYDSLRPDQRVRVDQITHSWGYLPGWVALNARGRAIKKVLNNYP